MTTPSQHTQILAAISRLEVKVDAAIEQSVRDRLESARHDAICSTERQELTRDVDEIKELAKANEKQIGNLWLKMTAAVAVIGAGGAGTIELIKALLA